MNNIKSLVLAVLLQAAATFCFADIYSFTTSNYGSVSGDYTSAMQLTGTITTSSPIPPNSDRYNFSSIITDFSFTDGLQTIDSSNGAFTEDVVTPALASTDSQGRIMPASFEVFSPFPALTNGSFNYIIVAPLVPAGIETELYRNATCEGISNIKSVLARNPLVPSRSLTRRWRSVVIDYLDITLVSFSS